MKRFFWIFLTLTFCQAAYSQNKYTGYKSLAMFRNDTVKYLQYNWGLGAAGQYGNQKLSLFFSQFSVPIQAIEFYCGNWHGTYRVDLIRLYTAPYKDIAATINTPVISGKTTKIVGPGGGTTYPNPQKRVDLDKYSILIVMRYPDPTRSEGRPLWSDIQKVILQLKKDGTTLVPWNNQYKTLLGPYRVADIQYNFGVFPELK